MSGLPHSMNCERSGANVPAAASSRPSSVTARSRDSPVPTVPSTGPAAVARSRRTGASAGISPRENWAKNASASRDARPGDVAFGALGQSIAFGYPERFRELNFSLATGAAGAAMYAPRWVLSSVAASTIAETW